MTTLTFFASLLYKTNSFRVAVRLFINRTQKTLKRCENISDTVTRLLYPVPFLFKDFLKSSVIY